MKKFIITSDIHLHPHRTCSLDAGMDRLNDGLSALRQTLEAAKKRKCDWWFLGDLKHVKTIWHQKALLGALEIMEDFPDVGKFLIHGNHDGILGGSGIRPFKDIPMTNIFTEPEIVKGDGYGFDTFAVWPHSSDMSGLPKFLKQAKKEKAKILFGHIFLQNSVVGNRDTPIAKGASLSDIGLAKKEVFDLAFLGDVHKAQLVPGSGDENGLAIYPGSPLGLNWGELERDKGCFYVDLADRKEVLKKIEIKAPRFRSFDWTTPGDVEENINWEGDFVRLIISPDFDKGWLESIRKRCGARWLKVILRKNSTNGAKKRSDIHAGMNRDQLLGEYVKARPPVSDAAMTLAAGKKLMGAE